MNISCHPVYGTLPTCTHIIYFQVPHDDGLFSVKKLITKNILVPRVAPIHVEQIQNVLKNNPKILTLNFINLIEIGSFPCGALL